MKKFLLVMCSLATILATACNKPKAPAATITIDGGKTAIEVAADATSATVAFNASEAWTASVEAITKATPEWLTLAPESGEAGANTLTLTLTANTAETSRSATIRIVCASETATVTLTQLGTKDEGGEPEPTTGAIVKEMHFSNFNRLFFTTDEAGRITRVHQIIGEVEAPISESFTDLTYSADQLTLTFYSNDSEEKNVDTYAMQDGRVTKLLNNDRYCEELTYTPDGMLATYTSGRLEEGAALDVMEYTWTDGNLTQMTMGQQTATIEYSTETSGIANLDMLSCVFMELFPEVSRYRLTGVTSRNLPISCTIPSTDNKEKITISYEFGANKAVSKITITRPNIEEEDSTTVELVY